MLETVTILLGCVFSALFVDLIGLGEAIVALGSIGLGAGTVWALSRN
jgi:hypothetical protein